MTMRRSPGRSAAIAVLALVCALAATSCGAFGKELDTGAAAMLNQFAAAMEDQDSTAAAGFTSAPGPAGTALQATLTGMSAQKVDVKVGHAQEYTDGTATFDLETTWQLGNEREFTTKTAGSARKLSLGWRVNWQPELLADDMPAGGSLRNIRTDARPSPVVLDRSGKPMLNLQTINEIVIDPGATRDLGAATTALAGIIAPLAPLVTPAVMTQQLRDSGNQPVTVVSVRESDMVALAGDPKSVPGVSIRKVPQLVLIDRRLDSPVLDGVHDYWQAIRDATSGWAVQMLAPGQKPLQLAGEQGPAGPNVPTTIDPITQLDALDAVVEVAQPASILVLDAKTGAIRASTRNDLATEHGITIGRQYPAGTTLGPAAKVINDVAGSDDSKAAALLAQLGLDVDFTIPGVRPEGGGQGIGAKPVTFRSEDLTVSALNMATLGVAIARGSSIAPSIIVGQPGRVSGGELGTVDPAVLGTVGKAMRDTATTGDASDLTNASGMRALVGTNGPQGPGWFVGISGSKVFVVYCEGERSGTAALAVAQRFLTPRVHPQ